MSKRAGAKRIAAIILLVIGFGGIVFGALGIAGGGSIEPYEARHGIVLYTRSPQHTMRTAP